MWWNLLLLSRLVFARGEEKGRVLWGGMRRSRIAAVGRGQRLKCPAEAMSVEDRKKRRRGGKLEMDFKEMGGFVKGLDDFLGNEGRK